MKARNQTVHRPRITSNKDDRIRLRRPLRDQRDAARRSKRRRQRFRRHAKRAGCGRKLGHLIGRGGFAEVFQVRDLWLKRDLALKAIRPDLGVSETILARFRREAEAVAALRHPNIVPIYDIGEAEGILYILMPLIKGESLKSLLTRDGRRPINEARRIMLEAASALGAAHEAGLIHRDIKPENIMLEGKARRVLVMDFGIAKVMDAAGDSTLTSTGTIVGTPHYMSPEQASGDPRIDHRTDQYSLAVVGYHMLTGAVPFEGESTRQVLFKQMMESPRSMRELVPEVPQALMEAVSRAMAKEAAERFPSMEAFAEAIEHTIAEETRAAALAALPRRKSRRGVWMAAGAGLLVVAAIGAALLVLCLSALALIRGDRDEARRRFEECLRSGPWPAFGFIAAEVELARSSRPER